MQSYPPQGGTKVSGIDSGFCMTRTDMESAHGAPIVPSSKRTAAGRVIGVNPCGCEPISHDGRSVSKQTREGVEQEHGFTSLQVAMAKAVRVSFFSCRA